MQLPPTNGDQRSARSATVIPSWLAWAVPTGVLVCLFVLWPAYADTGSLLSVDLVVLPTVPMPRSLFWLGPDLARRFPGFVPYSAVASLTGGLVAGRVMLTLSLFAIVVGVARLTSMVLPSRLAGMQAQLSACAGALCALSPFTLSRLSTGHLTTLWALATVPHVLCAAIGTTSPARSRACAVAGLTGFVAGAYSLAVVVSTVERPRQLVRELLSWTARNAVWILPGAFLHSQGFTSLVDPVAFAPRVPDATTLLGLPLGFGYWDPVAEASRLHRGLIALSALGLVLLCIVGLTHVPAATRRIFAGCMVIGFGVPLVAALPMIGDAISAFTRTPLGSPLREPHRLTGIGLVPLLATAAVGAATLVGLARSADRPRPPSRWTFAAALGTPLLIAALFASSSLPTVHRRLDPMPLPSSWEQASEIVRRDGGITFTLPWTEYVELRIDHRRRVIHPLPDLFGGRVVSSTDPGLGRPVNEAADPRAGLGRATALALLAGDDAAEQLRSLGVQWVAVLKVEQAADLDLSAQSALQPVLRSPSLDLFRVRGTTVATLEGPIVPAGVQRGTGPYVDEPWAWGWWSSTMLGRSDAGLLEGPGPGRRALFLPAIPAVITALGTIWLACGPRRRRWTHRNESPVPGGTS